MGLFDYIIPEYPLPNGHDPKGEEYQTKDTPAQMLDTYRLTREGRLEHELYDTEDRSDPNAKGFARFAGLATRVPKGWEEVPFHGDLTFYTSNVSGISNAGVITSDDQPPVTREYVALFKDGQLIDLRGGVSNTFQGQKHFIDHEEWHRVGSG